MPYTNIDKPIDYFEPKLYTGNAGTNAITGLNFQPDWLWIKSTSRTDNHVLLDVLRGTNRLRSNTTGAQADISGDGFTSLDSNGFTLNGSGGGGETNANSASFTSWNWRAGGSGSSNGDGDITSTVSVNTTAGFSIVSHTGTGSTATIGHGLGAVPKVIFSRKTAVDNWFSYFSDIGPTKYLLLEASDTTATSSNVFNDTAPTSSVFTKGGPANENAATYISYCFAEKTGFSKFGSYTGNGNTDGTFVYTGFKPAWVIVKNSSATANWVATDNKISFNGKGSNESNVLFPSTTGTLNDGYGLQMYSNGFALKGGDSASATVNGSGNIYVYMAFAEAPLVGSNNIPATAR
tara:strand:- start:10465 stop:11511 length:1047 start_codon:yes stop_codon:yes gene_type:complete